MKRFLAIFLVILMAFPSAFAEEAAQQEELAVPIVSRDAFCQALEEYVGLPIAWNEPTPQNDLLIESCKSFGGRLAMIRKEDRVIEVVSVNILDLEDMKESLKDCLGSTMIALITLNRAMGKPMDQAQQDAKEWIELTDYISVMIDALEGEESSIFLDDNWIVETKLNVQDDVYVLMVSVCAYEYWLK